MMRVILLVAFLAYASATAITVGQVVSGTTYSGAAASNYEFTVVSRENTVQFLVNTSFASNSPTCAWVGSITYSGLLTANTFSGTGDKSFVATVQTDKVIEMDPSTVVTLAISMANSPGCPTTQSYNVQVMLGGLIFAYSDVTAMTTKTATMPCCGAVQQTSYVPMPASEHNALQAVISGDSNVDWDTAEMINAAFLSVDVPVSFKNDMSTVRTCLSNQSCSIEADNYFVRVNTASSNTMSGTYDMTLSLIAGASTTVLSSIALLVVALNALFQ